MERYKGKKATILEINRENDGIIRYKLDIDNEMWNWTEDMFREIVINYSEEPSRKVENKMNFEEILNIYYERKKESVYAEKYRKSKKILEKDPVQNLILETENQINVMLDRDEENLFSFDINDYFCTEETRKLLKGYEKEFEKKILNYSQQEKEIKAQLKAIPEDENFKYDYAINILKVYEILDKEGKINA